MTRAIFREDRHIYLKKCLLQPNRPPISTFINAQLPYDIVTVKSRIMVPLYLNLQETLDFWRHLGKSVTEIHVEPNYMPPDWYEILLEMPHLEIFVGKMTLEKLAGELYVLQDENPKREFFKHLKKVKVSLFTLKNIETNTNFFEELQDVTPTDTKFFADTVDVIQCLAVEDVLEGLRKLKLKFKRLELWDIHLPVVKFIPFDDLPFTGMRLIHRENMSPDQLRAFFHKHPNVNDVYLESHFRYFHFPLSQFTEIYFTLPNADNGTLKFLEPCVNLRTLVIGLTLDICLFGHEPLNFPKLTKFSMGTNCRECLTAMANSFPSLQSYDEVVSTRNYLPILVRKLRNWRNLKEMRITLTQRDLTDLAQLTEQLEGETFLTLRTLNICVENCSGEDFVKMSQIFPNLKTLRITINEILDLNEIVQGIVPAFKELIELFVYTKCFSEKDDATKKISVDPDTSNRILKHLEEFGDSLRVRKFLSLRLRKNISLSQQILTLPDLNVNQSEAAYRLYKYLKQLISFRCSIDFRRSDLQAKIDSSND